MNEALVTALDEMGLDVPVFARVMGVKEKTVENWLTEKHLPQPFSRSRAAQILLVEQTDLWPDEIPQYVPRDESWEPCCCCV